MDREKLTQKYLELRKNHDEKEARIKSRKSNNKTIIKLKMTLKKKLFKQIDSKNKLNLYNAEDNQQEKF